MIFCEEFIDEARGGLVQGSAEVGLVIMPWNSPTVTVPTTVEL